MQWQPTSIGKRVGAWLLGLRDPSITVCYDYHADMDLLEASLHSAGLWTRLSPGLKPTHVGYLIGESGVESAMEASWTASFAADGVGRHHALADARALRAGYVSMHGGGRFESCSVKGSTVVRKIRSL